MPHRTEKSIRLVAYLRALEAAGTLDRRTPPAAGDLVLVFRGGTPSVEPWPVGDASAPGVWVVGRLERA